MKFTVQINHFMQQDLRENVMFNQIQTNLKGNNILGLVMKYRLVQM